MEIVKHHQVEAYTNERKDVKLRVHNDYSCCHSN